jgi:hypothetical protein
MTKFSEKIIETIQKENIHQKSSSYFLLKNISFWVLFFSAVLLSAASFSVILFFFLESHIEIFKYAPFSARTFFLTTLPFSLIVFFGIFLGVAAYGAHHTKKGYKISFSYLLAGNIFLIVFLGYCFHFVNGAKVIDEHIAQAFPFYTKVENRKKHIWSHPEKGFLFGIVVSDMSHEQFLIIEDNRGRSWKVDISHVHFVHPHVSSFLKEKTLSGRKIKIIGKRKGKTLFRAYSLLPWDRSPRQNSRGFHRPPPPYFEK